MRPALRNLVQAYQFKGTICSYQEIVKWMKDEGCTHAKADEVEFRRPIMLIIDGSGATQAVNPGDWIFQRRTDPVEFTTVPDHVFQLMFERMYGDDPQYGDGPAEG